MSLLLGAPPSRGAPRKRRAALVATASALAVAAVVAVSAANSRGVGGNSGSSAEGPQEHGPRPTPTDEAQLVATTKSASSAAALACSSDIPSTATGMQDNYLTANWYVVATSSATLNVRRCYHASWKLLIDGTSASLEVDALWLNTGSTSSWTGKNSTLTREGDDDDGGVFTVGDGEVVAFGTGIDDTHDDDPEHDDDAGCYSPGLTNCGGHRWIALYTCSPSEANGLVTLYFESPSIPDSVLDTVKAEVSSEIGGATELLENFGTTDQTGCSYTWD